MQRQNERIVSSKSKNVLQFELLVDLFVTLMMRIHGHENVTSSVFNARDNRSSFTDEILVLSSFLHYFHFDSSLFELSQQAVHSSINT